MSTSSLTELIIVLQTSWRPRRDGIKPSLESNIPDKHVGPLQNSFDTMLIHMLLCWAQMCHQQLGVGANLLVTFFHRIWQMFAFT